MLDTLVRELAPRLLAYVRRVMGPAHAEDVVAEAFCRAAENMPALRAAERPDLYVVTVTRNLCRDRWRRRQPESWDDERLASQPTAQAEPDAETELDEQLHALRAAIDQLPEALREVVVLRVSVNMTFEEIARLLEIPLGTALSRMHAATQKLKLLMEPEHERT